MPSFHIAFDERDPELGQYFEQCKNDIVQFIRANLHDVPVEEIRSAQCNVANIGIRLPLINSQNYLFIAYSHGDETSLIVDGIAYIEDGINSHLFRNSLFYTNACLAGVQLGLNLPAQGCLAFIGNSRKVDVLAGTNRSISLQCDNYGLKLFIIGSNAGDAFEGMKNYYTQKIDYLRETLFDPLSAAILVKCRESLVVFGNLDIRIESFP